MEYKPDNYSTVSPYLIVTDAHATLHFIQTVFGAEILRSFTSDSDRVIHSEARIGDSIVMIADCTDDWPSIPSNVHVYVADVDDVYRRALVAGAISVQEPIKKDDDDKRGGVKDNGGITWWIATKVA